MSNGYEGAAELLRVLGSPIRLQILATLTSGPLPVHDLVDRLDQRQPLISQHLRILRTAGLIRSTAQGKNRVYEIDDDHVSHIVADALKHSAENRL